MSIERKAFNFYRSYWETGKLLSDKDRLAFYDAMFERQFNGTEPNLKGTAQLAWVSQKHSIDSQIKGWEDKMKVKLQVIDNHASLPPPDGSTEPPLLPPLVQEEEKGKEEEKEKEKLRILLNDSIWCCDEFYKIWFRWKKYKKEQHRFTYKTEDSEQTALRKLWSESGGKLDIAGKIIDESIANGWAGFFKLKNNQNGTHQQTTPRLGEGDHTGKQYTL